MEPVKALIKKPKNVSYSRKPNRVYRKQNESVTALLTSTYKQTSTSVQQQNSIPIGAANDPLEQEADRVADKIVAGDTIFTATQKSPLIQEVCAECEQKDKNLQRRIEKNYEEEQLQQQPEKPESELQLQAVEEEIFQLQPLNDDEELQRQLKASPEEDESFQTEAIHSEIIQAACTQCETKELHRQPDVEQELRLTEMEEENELQRMTANIEGEEEDSLQRRYNTDKTVNRESVENPRPSIWQRIRNVFKRGHPLPQIQQKFFSEAMGHDYSTVKIHTDNEAADTAKAIGARAYAYKHHVVFATGEFQPHTHEGKHLLAHELTHTIQQGAVKPVTAEPTAVTNNKNGSSSSASIHSTPVLIQGDWVDELGDFAGDVYDSSADLLGDTAELVGDVVDGAIELGADAIWAIVRRVAPQALLDIFEEVKEKGFFGYIKEKVAEAAQHIFDGAENQSGMLSTMMVTFARLAVTATEIMAGLASGDCEPLFTAMRCLRDTVAELATDAWNAISDFFRPVGEFFSDLWDRFGAPVMDWLSEFATDAWNFIKDLGQEIWDWTRPLIDAIRSAVSDAWDWIKEQLGLSSDEGNSSGGLINWVKEKASSAWTTIKTELQPVIRPIQQVIEKVQAVLPLDAIINFRDTLNNWLQQAASMAQNMDPAEGANAADNQASLREHILPAILQRIQEFRDRLVSTGVWISEKIGGAISTGQSFLNALSTHVLISGVSSLFRWLSDSLDTINHWVTETVQGLFASLGNGLVRLSQFLEPILNMFRRLLQVLGNLLGMLPEFLLGPLWWVLPMCLKEVIKTFIVENILNRIPLFQQLTSVGDIWGRIQATALQILQQIFVDGNLGGALWTFFQTMLNLIGIPAQLVVQIIANAAQAFSDILMNPLGFFNNFLRSMWQGTTHFFGNILTHLYNGVTDWLFGQLDEAGITPPDLTNFQSILAFVFELMGISMQQIWTKLAEHLGEETVDRIRSTLETLEGAFEWIYIAYNEGPAGVWRMIQERLSNLWDTVLTSVVTWINTAIIGQASRWLLSLLDVTGITPIINALKSVYRAIESFVAYINEMLQIVNSVVRGIADIAKGAIESAATHVENSLAESVPIVVGFLANQFGLGALGSRIHELVEGLREMVDGALDWLITQAIRLGQGFLNMLRSGVDAVRNWWQARKEFTDSADQTHSLYFQNEQDDLIVESTPTPVGQYLNNLAIADDDPQKAQKDTHKTNALRVYNDITTLKQELSRRQNAREDTSEQQAQLQSKFDILATHLTPLMVAGAGNGRVPNPLTLATLDQAAPEPPTTPEEAQADLDAARQLIILAKEQVDGTAALGEYFERIRTRFVLEKVEYFTEGEQIKILLKATQQIAIDLDEPVTTDTDGLTQRSLVSYTSGSSAGDTVAIGMVADPVGEDIKDDGSTPRDSALSGVMNKLITDPRQSSSSKYVKGHLLNHNIGGPGTAENMYPITGQANRDHSSKVEETVKSWVLDKHYLAYYSVQVSGISEHIPHPDQKHPENWINASMQCYAYVKYANNEVVDPISETITSRYTQGNADASSGSGVSYQLDSRLKAFLDGIDPSSRNQTAISNALSGMGPSRTSVLLFAYNHYDEGDLDGELDPNQKSSLTYINNHEDEIRQGLTDR